MAILGFEKWNVLNFPKKVFNLIFFNIFGREGRGAREKVHEFRGGRDYFLFFFHC